MFKFKSVDEYIDSAPSDVRQKLKQIRRIIKEVAPNAIEKISYGMPYYGYKGRLSYYAYFKDHIGLYVMHGVADDLKSEVKEFKSGVATLRFPLNKELPLGLIKRIIKVTKEKNEKE